MKQDLVHLSYIIPQIHLFEREPYRRSLIVKIKLLLWHIRKLWKHGAFDRTQEYVYNVYEDTYRPSNQKWFQERSERKYPIREKNELLTVDGHFLRAVYVQTLSDIFNQLQCTSVLEVGSGRGNNIIALAALNLSLRLTGLEKSKNGYERSLEWKKDITKTAFDLVGIGEKIDTIDFKKIRFVHGDALSMPLPDKCVDVSFTHLVLEQIPHRYPQVLDEMRRVSRRYCIFIEGFREALSLVDKVFLKRKGRFRFSYKNFKKYGLRPVFFTDQYPQKTKFGTGLLIAEVL